MSITLASHGAVSWSPGPSTTENIPITCSAGDVIFVCSSVAPSLAGESFTTIASLFDPVYKCIAASAHTGSNISFTTGSFSPGAAIAEAYTGITSSGVTVGSVNGSNSSVASASVTTAAANSLVLLMATSPQALSSAGAGYTLEDNTGNSSVFMAEEQANSVTGSSGTVVTPTLNLSVSSAWKAVAISLSPGAAGGAGSRRRSWCQIIEPLGG